MIELTVCLPLFRARRIGWLPLEGLVRQRGITFAWELVVAEETDDPETFGWERIAPYEPGLKAAGCRRIQYLPLKEWIPLGTKIARMARLADPGSRIGVENSADYYPAPGRLAGHYAAFQEEDIDQHLPTKAIHYSIGEDRAVLFDSRFALRKDAVVGRATRMDLLRQLPEHGPRQGCDGWMWRQFHEIRRREGRRFAARRDRSDTWMFALSTVGFNNLSPTTLPVPRRFHWNFTPYPLAEIRARIPPEILARLAESRLHLAEHRHLGHAPVEPRSFAAKIRDRWRRGLSGRSRPNGGP